MRGSLEQAGRGLTSWNFVNVSSAYCGHRYYDIHSSQGYLQIQCNLHQNSSGILHRNRIDDPKICIKPQRILNSQSSLKKEEQS